LSTAQSLQNVHNRSRRTRSTFCFALCESSLSLRAAEG
jgi:hypothetical protein